MAIRRRDQLHSAHKVCLRIKYRLGIDLIGDYVGEIMELSRRRLAKAYHIFSEGLADMGIPTPVRKPDNTKSLAKLLVT